MNKKENILIKISDDILKSYLPKYLTLEDFPNWILATNRYIKWEDFEFKIEYIEKLYSKLIHKNNKIIFEEWMDKQNKNVLNIIFILLKKDYEKELKSVLLYNLYFELIYNNEFEKIQYLIDNYNLDLSIPDNQPLHLTIRLDNYFLFDFLIKDNNVLSNLDHLTLYICCIYKKFNYFKYIIENINKVFDLQHYRTGLFYACENGSYKIVEYILSKNIIQNPTQDNRNYLSAAISSGNLNLIKYLIEDVGFSIKNNNQLALRIACEKEHIHVVRYLLTIEDIEPDLSESYCLRISCKKNNISIVKLLLDDGRVNPQDANYESFIICCKFGYLDILQLLVKYNKLMDLKFQNNILIQIAEYYDNKDIISFLNNLNI